MPLFITELDVRQNDVSKRAQGYEDIIRLLFSHPNIHGIVIWGFWKEIMTYETAALAEGKKKIKVTSYSTSIYQCRTVMHPLGP